MVFNDSVIQMMRAENYTSVKEWRAGSNICYKSCNISVVNNIKSYTPPKTWKYVDNLKS